MAYAPSLAQSKKGRRSTASTSALEVDFDDNIVAGSLLVVIASNSCPAAGTNLNCTITDSLSNSWTRQGAIVVGSSADGNAVSLHTAVANNSGDCDIDITPNQSSKITAVIMEFKRVLLNGSPVYNPSGFIHVYKASSTAPAMDFKDVYGSEYFCVSGMTNAQDANNAIAVWGGFGVEIAEEEDGTQYVSLGVQWDADASAQLHYWTTSDWDWGVVGQIFKVFDGVAPACSGNPKIFSGVSNRNINITRRLRGLRDGGD